MSRTVMFVHGGFVTPVCWDRFASYFEARGYKSLAPASPGKDRPIQAIRTDPSPLAGLGIRQIVDHYDGIVRGLEEPPILIGHSFGGLFVQLLLDRGLGAAGIAIDSAPPKGVFAFEPTALRSLGRVLVTSVGRRRIVRWSFGEFRYAFAHTMPLGDARAEFDRNIVPESGLLFLQAAMSAVDPASPARVDFTRPDRAPLLFIAGDADRAMSAGIVRRTVRAYRRGGSPVDLRVFPGRTHWLIAQEGWEEVAQACIDWIESLRAGESRAELAEVGIMADQMETPMRS